MWSRVSPSGSKPPARSGFSLAVGPTGRALLFGGVCDEEEDETLEGDFYNDLYLYDINKHRWFPAQLKVISGNFHFGTYSKYNVSWTFVSNCVNIIVVDLFFPPLVQGCKSEKKKRRRGKKGGETGEGSGEGQEEEGAAAQGPVEVIKEIVTEDGTVMTIKEIIPGTQAEEESEEEEEEGEEGASAILVEPCARSSAMATVKYGKLYLYGGMFEVGDRQFTLNDLYCLDLHKMDQWEVLVEMDPSK